MTQPSTVQGANGFSRILVGVDFSPSSQFVLDTVRARFPGAAVCLAHVTDSRVSATPDLLGGVTPIMPDPTLLRTLEQADGQRLSTLAAAGEETEMLVGDPVTGIIAAAQSWGADLIVVGTHAHGALEHFFVGSSAEKVVARSPIPVLSIRAPQ